MENQNFSSDKCRKHGTDEDSFCIYEKCKVTEEVKF